MNKKLKTRSALSRTAAYAKELRELVRLASGFSAASSDETRNTWVAIDNLFNGLCGQGGWTRKNIFELIVDTIEKHAESLSQDALDALMDYESAMCGYVARTMIPRFPGEPQDQKEFERYVFSYQWLE